MSALIVAALGAGIGAGLLMIVRALSTRPIALAETAVALDRPGVAVNAQADPAGLTRPQSRLGAAGLAIMGVARFGDRDNLVEQLRVLDKSLERHAYEKMLSATAGFAIPTVLGVMLGVGGVAPPLAPIGAASLILAVIGFIYPNLPLADKVEERRRGFRHAFSAYLDLVTILLAGGAGIESALEGAAESEDGWAFSEIRRALRRARLTRQTPWDAFEQLGTELGVNELNELAASISLAGGHGARVKASLTAKADALRAAQAAELETAAEACTEKMIVPVVVMILGLVLFIAFGAVDAITDGGTSTFASNPGVTSPTDR